MGVGGCRHACGGSLRAGTGEFKQGGDHGSGVTVASSKEGGIPHASTVARGLGGSQGADRSMALHEPRRRQDWSARRWAAVPPKSGRGGAVRWAPHCPSQHGHSRAIRSGAWHARTCFLLFRRSDAVSPVKDDSHVPGTSAWCIDPGHCADAAAAARPWFAGAAGRPWRTWMVLGTPWPGPPSKLRKPDAGVCYPGIPHQVACSDG